MPKVIPGLSETAVSEPSPSDTVTWPTRNGGKGHFGPASKRSIGAGSVRGRSAYGLGRRALSARAPAHTESNERARAEPQNRAKRLIDRETTRAEANTRGDLLLPAPGEPSRGALARAAMRDIRPAATAAMAPDTPAPTEAAPEAPAPPASGTGSTGDNGTLSATESTEPASVHASE